MEKSKRLERALEIYNEQLEALWILGEFMSRETYHEVLEKISERLEWNSKHLEEGE